MNRQQRRAAKGRSVGDGSVGTVAPAKQWLADGSRHFRAGRFSEALGSYQRAIAIEPDSAEIRTNLGTALARLARLDEAVAAFREAIARAPGYGTAHYNLGRALMELGKPDEAAAAYRQAAALSPASPEIHYNLGNALLRQERPEDAVAAYRRALALNPSYARACYNLGMALRELGRWDEAAASLRQAIALEPGRATAHAYLGDVLRELGQSGAAAEHCRHAVALAPNDAICHVKLGNVQRELGQMHEAIASFRRATALAPELAEPASGLTVLCRTLCDWQNSRDEEERCRAHVRAGTKGIAPFMFFNLDSTAAEQLACARLATEAATQGAVRLPAPAVALKDKLRIGYVSADFRQHPTTVLTRELFERHDRRRFEVVGYSYGPDDGSTARQRVMRAFDRFVDMRLLGHAEAAKRIRADGIDILIDLMGHTKLTRLPILAWRPAAVQVSFLGYAGTTGADFSDYIIADPVVLPRVDQPFFDERIVHLPHCFMPVDTQLEIAQTVPDRAQCGLPERGFVFCCFNNSHKLTPVIFAIWMRLLQAVPGSVLWLYQANDTMRDNLRREAVGHGVAAERLVFAPPMAPPHHMARQRLADLFLDTLPMNAHTTAMDALWMGLPVLTCTGSTYPGRVATSLLHALELPELVTPSLAAYEARAVQLASEDGALEAVRRKLELNRHTAPLFDMARYTSHLESAYFRMWEIRAAGNPPEPFSVAP